MFTKSSKSVHTVLAISVAFAVLTAPAAQAETRDTGVGRVIAAQGNQALQMIKAELRAALKAHIPALPSEPAIAKPAARRVVLTPVNGAAAAVRCAE
jgi:hypothetical protein